MVSQLTTRWVAPSPPFICPSWRCQRKWQRGLSHISFLPWSHLFLIIITITSTLWSRCQSSSILLQRCVHLLRLSDLPPITLFPFTFTASFPLCVNPQHRKECLSGCSQSHSQPPPTTQHHDCPRTIVTRGQHCYKDSERLKISSLLWCTRSVCVTVTTSIQKWAILRLFYIYWDCVSVQIFLSWPKLLNHQIFIYT